MTATIVRTCFAYEVNWIMLWKVCSRLDEVAVEVVEDRALDGVTPDELVALGRFSWFVFAADERTLTDPEMPLLALDLNREPGRTFRVSPANLSTVAVNLDLFNMDFHNFAENTDPDGVFRGFS